MHRRLRKQGSTEISVIKLGYDWQPSRFGISASGVYGSENQDWHE